MPPSPIDLNTVHTIARLAHLDVTPDQAQQLQTHLAAIVGYVAHLQEVDVRGVLPPAPPPLTRQSLRQDLPGPLLDFSQLAAIAPSTQGRLVSLPRVL